MADNQTPRVVVVRTEELAGRRSRQRTRLRRVEAVEAARDFKPLDEYARFNFSYGNQRGTRLD